MILATELQEKEQTQKDDDNNDDEYIARMSYKALIVRINCAQTFDWPKRCAYKIAINTGSWNEYIMYHHSYFK